MSSSMVRRARVIAGALLLTGVMVASAFAESVRVKVDRTSVWGNTTGTAGVIGVVRRGEVLEVLGHEGRWLLVVLPSDPRQKGYVLVRQTEPVPDRDRPAAPASGNAGREPQGRPAPAAPVAPAARRRVPKPPPYIYVGVTGQASPLDFTGTDSVTTLIETETRTVDYTPSRVPGFEISVGRELWRNLIIAGSVVQISGRGTAGISAQIPHPLFYNTPRSVSGEADARRVETALHIEFAKVVHRSRAYTLTIGGGPSVFFLKQDLLNQLDYDETYPFDSVAYTGASMTRHSATAYGAHLQGDYVKSFSKKLSWQVSGRYSYGEAKLEVNGATVKAKTGQGQVSGGLRIGF